MNTVRVFLRGLVIVVAVFVPNFGKFVGAREKHRGEPINFDSCYLMVEFGIFSK